jgi:hypothetical protein
VTVIEPERIECAACGTAFEVYVFLSTNNFGEPEVEWVARDTAKCPNCGHEIPMEVIEFVGDGE